MVLGMIIATLQILMITGLDLEEEDFQEVHHEIQHSLMVHMVHLMVLLMVLPMVRGEMGQEDRIMEIMGMETEGETSKVTFGVEEVVVVDLNKIEKKIPEEENKIQS